MRNRIARGATSVLLSLAVPAFAQTTETLGEIHVIGHYDNGVGTSDAASQGYITPKLIEERPMLRPGEVLEYVPGVVITQHSGEGKANQYFLRGFNLDHGTDFLTTIAHMPVNMPTHAHGQGYSDLNFMIPELVSRVDYQKGPYFAGDGDFATAGAAHINYYTQMPKNIASASVGQYGYRRALMAGSPQTTSEGTWLYGLELFHNDGPWTNPSDYNKANGVLSYSRGTNADGINISAMAYNGKWNATDQIAQRAVDQGQISRFDSLDPSDGGESSRYSLSFDRHKAIDGGTFHFDAYAIRYRLDLFSNFTYFLKDPVNGDQFEQLDERTVYGLEPSWVINHKIGGMSSVSTFGIQLRRDNIGKVALYNTAERQRLSTVREDSVRQTGAGAFYENALQWNDWFKTVAGIRADSYRADVTSDNPLNSGTATSSITSPKLNLIFGPWAKTEYFYNWGQGFHSNDARGATITVDPGTGAPAQRVTPLVKTRGEEVGARTEAVPHLQSSLALWRLKLDSELVFAGDAGTTEASRPSYRRGIEWSNRYIPRSWLLVDFDVSASRANFTDDNPAGNYIPGAIDRAASLGVTVNELGAWSVSAHMRYFGPRPLIEDNSQRSQSSTITSLRVAYKIDPKTRLNLDVFNLFNSDAHDIDYYYASQLRGEAAPVNDIHFHPTEPRTLRVSLIYNF